VEVRSSDRIRAQPNADDTQLERAQRIAESKDNNSYKGINFISKYSLNSYTNKAVEETASRLGISLGRSPSEVENSIRKIKDNDFQRTLTVLKRNEERARVDDNISANQILDKAMDLSDDLETDDFLAEDCCIDRAKAGRNAKKASRKKDLEKIIIRRSARLKNKNR
jgi:hypothetical protein